MPLKMTFYRVAFGLSCFKKTIDLTKRLKLISDGAIGLATPQESIRHQIQQLVLPLPQAKSKELRHHESSQ